MESPRSARVLTKEELETPRTAAEMLAWVDSAHARFNTKELKAQARVGKLLTSELILEARPMALFADRYYGASPQVLITHVLGNQNYDAIVEDRRVNSEPIRYLEATSTLRTYEDSLRMELLNAEGHVAAYGPVTAHGPRHKRTSIKAEAVAVEHTTLRAEHLKRVRDAVARKAQKEYEQNTALIIAVDDSAPFREPDDARVLDELVRDVLLPMLMGTNFIRLALEGSAGLHLCYSTGPIASPGPWV